MMLKLKSRDYSVSFTGICSECVSVRHIPRSFFGWKLFMDYAAAPGGCAKNCEILPQSAYALRLHTCEEVVRF